LVIRAQRLEAALLVGLTTPNTAPLTPTDQKAIIESIWPTVVEANAATPAHAKVAKFKIMFVDPSKPMLRAPKGTIQRKPTLTAYIAEINRLYNEDEEQADTGDPREQANVNSVI